MDLSDTAKELNEYIANEIGVLDGVDTSISEFIASNFETLDVPEAESQMQDMLTASVADPDAAADAIQSIVAKCSVKWQELLATADAEDGSEGDEDGEGGGPTSQPAADGEDGSAPAPALQVLKRDDDEDVFAVGSDLKAAIMCQFYNQAGDDEEATAWEAETAPGTFNEQAARLAERAKKQAAKAAGKAVEPSGKEAAQPKDFSGRMAQFKGFLDELTSDVPSGPKAGGRRARRHARQAAGGRGGDSSDEDDAPAPAPAVPASRVVAFDPMDIRLDNREFSAFVERSKREAAKGQSEAESARERAKAEQARAAKELARNAHLIKGSVVGKHAKV